jgi:signal transduction histidine kinase
VSAISHEIISPVSNIAGFTRLLSSDSQAVLDERTRDLLQRIRRNAIRLAHLVEEAGTVARLYWELEKPRKEPFDLRPVIHGALKDAAEVVGSGESGPQLTLPEGDLPAEGDAVRLRVAVAGLLVNLAKDLNSRRIMLGLEETPPGWTLTAWHANTGGEESVFTEVEGEGGGPSAVVVMELFRALGCAGRVFVSPEGSRKLVFTLP